MLQDYRILIIDDDFVVRSSLEDHLRDLSDVQKIVHAENGKRGLARIIEEDYDLVFLDIDLPLMTGMEVLRQVYESHAHIKFILMTAYGRIPDAVEAIKLGAYTYIEKPLRPAAVKKLMLEISEAKSLLQSAEQASPVVFENGKELIGGGGKMNELLVLMSKISKVNTPILIQGESGTGKELVARAIHYNSPRKSENFVTVNCSAVPENLFESEFFGHEKGSFTGANEKKIGRFQYAEGGTLFLDEIGDLSLSNQVKLLRALQEKTFSPLGSNLEVKFDVRILAATHKNLETMVSEGLFRQDLYFRLNVMGVFLPALKERREDVPKLIQNFIKKFNQKHSRDVLGCKPDFLDKLMSYDFPGNVRELENAIERAFVLSDGQWLEVSSLPVQIFSDTSDVVDGPSIEVKIESELLPEIKVSSEDLDFQKNKEDFEKKFIEEALRRSGGMLNQTALQANIPKKTLQRKIQKYGIDVSSFKKKK